MTLLHQTVKQSLNDNNVTSKQLNVFLKHLISSCGDTIDSSIMKSVETMMNLNTLNSEGLTTAKEVQNADHELFCKLIKDTTKFVIQASECLTPIEIQIFKNEYDAVENVADYLSKWCEL